MYKLRIVVVEEDLNLGDFDFPVIPAPGQKIFHELSDTFNQVIDSGGEVLQDGSVIGVIQVERE